MSEMAKMKGWRDREGWWHYDDDKWLAEQKGSQWWITDGRESFRMVSAFVANEMARYLNKGERGRE